MALAPAALRRVSEVRQRDREAGEMQWRRNRAWMQQRGPSGVCVWFRECVGGALLSTGAVRIGRVRVCVWEGGSCWLGVELTVCGLDVVGWIGAEELVGLVGGDDEMAAALWGDDRVGWDVWGQCWREDKFRVLEGRSSVRVWGWYVPVEVTDEVMGGGSGTTLTVRARLVAIGLDAGRYRGALKMAKRQWWGSVEMSRQRLRGVQVTTVGDREEAVVVSDGGELVDEWDGGVLCGGVKGGDSGWVSEVRAIWEREQRWKAEKVEADVAAGVQDAVPWWRASRAELFFEAEERDVVYERG